MTLPFCRYRQIPTHTKVYTFIASHNNNICYGLGIFSDKMSPDALLEDFKLVVPPPTKLEAWSPAHYMHLHAQHLVYICIMTRCTKNPVGPIPSVQQEVCFFDSQLRFCHQKKTQNKTPPTDLITGTTLFVRLVTEMVLLLPPDA